MRVPRALLNSVGDPCHFGADPDLRIHMYLWLTYPDPTPFFSDFKDAKKCCFFCIFSYNLPADTLSSVLKI
jgi:hypothetical protein